MSKWTIGDTYKNTGAAYWTAGINGPSKESSDGVWGNQIECYGATEAEANALRDRLLSTLDQPQPEPADAVSDANIPTSLDDLQLQLIEVTEERDHLRTELAAQHARGVPDAIPDGAVIFGDAEDETYRDGWNACRKAMLAAAPSPGESE